MKRIVPAGEPTGEAERREFPYWRRNLIALPCAGFLSSLGFSISWPFLPLMVRGLGVQDNLVTWVGYIMLMFYIIGFAINPLWGGLADHYGRKLMVLRATLGMGAFMMLVPLAASPLAFACLLMLVGVFNGSTAAGNALIVANTPPRRMGTALTLVQSGALVGRTLGPAVGAVIAAVIAHYHWMFWISGACMLAGGLLVLIFVQEVKQLADGAWKPHWLGDLRDLLAIPRMMEIFLLSFVFSVLWSGNVPVMSIYVLELLERQPPGAGTEEFWIGAVAMGLALSSLAVLPVWGRVLDRVEAGRVMVFTTAMAVLTHLPLLFLQTPLQLVLTRVAFGLTATAMLPALVSLLKDNAPRGMDARAISYATSFQFIAMGLAPFGAGMIGPLLGLRTYFGVTIALTAIGLFLWLRADQRARAAS